MQNLDDIKLKLRNVCAQNVPEPWDITKWSDLMMLGEELPPNGQLPPRSILELVPDMRTVSTSTNLKQLLTDAKRQPTRLARSHVAMTGDTFGFLYQHAKPALKKVSSLIKFKHYCLYQYKFTRTLNQHV